MAIGHATGIARDAGLPEEAALAAPTIIAGANMLGGLLGGLLLDAAGVLLVLAALPLLAAAALLLLALAPAGEAVIAGLGLTGLAYGATIAALSGGDRASLRRGRGGPALRPGLHRLGLLSASWPWIAGLLFDRLGGYRVAAAGRLPGARLGPGTARRTRALPAAGLTAVTVGFSFGKVSTTSSWLSPSGPWRPSAPDRWRPWCSWR